MRFLVFLIAALVSGTAAAADQVWQQDGITVTMHSTPCKIASIAKLLAEVGKPSAATSTLGSETRAACWAKRKDGNFVIVDERGTGGILPPEGLAKKPTI